jgi:transcriptional regulator of acetoin/glycerol metabolism
LFLDEIGDVPLSAQQRLLRVLQEREVVPLGASRAEKVDVRLVAATHRDLAGDIEAGRFRDDLFFRLNVFRVAIPPLRDRPGDIPLLVEHILREAGGARISPLATRSLLAYDWPGNVRELLSALESARIRAEGRPIEAQHLPEEVRRPRARGESNDDRYRHGGEPDDERAAILHALRRAEGVKVRAAELLGMSRTTLWRKLRDHGIEAD